VKELRRHGVLSPERSVPLTLPWRNAKDRRGY